ncbi:IclR family transcriptional regulator [Aneurinibacillus uraniidurans]|uniref:IclR family transcriptional regulator n=1 Tax=Aneurinibacillus uraniidurans TaxID=2966586 RepID=UPI00234A1AC1|nr:IclR family transcriptional regulator [Aneurinibacillus sp. B1]WCN39217.1 IclR family transcriptional regulator [Aneurinibacillus sp. B1]
MSANKTIIKSLDVLQLFYSHKELSLQEMVALSGMPKTSLHRLLGSLEEMGFLQRNESGLYELGLIFLRLGHLVAERLDIRNVALPIMRRVRDELEEAVNLVVRDGDDVIYIEKVDTRQPVRVYTRIGRRAPLYGGACPRALLAFLTDDERSRYIDQVDLIKVASGTITDRNQLKTITEEAREKGYTVSHSELEDYSSAVGAPIFDYTGGVVASLSIAGLTTRFSSDRLPLLIEKVQEAATEISEKLGWVQK